MGPILAASRSVQAGPPAPESKSEWLDPEWQAVHSFTAMVEALRHLERIPVKSPRAWRARVAWGAVLEASKAVRDIAGWGPEQWETIHRKGLDHWLRPKGPRRTEEETLLRRLQIELPGFGWDEDQP